MNVYEFYKNNSGCPKMATLEGFSEEENRNALLRKALKMVCGSIGAKMKKEAIIQTITSFFEDSYREKVFTFSWQKEKQVENDTLLFERLLDWLESSKLEPVKPFVATQMSFPDITFADGTNTLSAMVQLIMQDERGNYRGLIIHTNSSSRSMAGKSILTHAACDLYPLIAKYTLEETYTNIEIDSVYLTSEKDTPENMEDKFIENKTAKSNVHRLSYANYYTEDGIFDRETFFVKLLEVIHYKPQNSCDRCRVYALCNTPSSFSNVSEKEEDEMVGSYKMPTFTEVQEKVIAHRDGPMLVCAGPGSGKTATLIGRIKHLVDTGIAPEFILVVTFTNEAADELRMRCLSFLSEDSLPNISTLNSFCYGILKENVARVGKPVKVLNDDVRMELIKKMVSVLPALKGFKYGMEYAQNGLYNTIANRLDYYKKCCDKGIREDFFKKYPNCGEDFEEFATQYFLCVKAQGYITFDEQISLCNQLFKEHPETLLVYQNIYQYIMVDEYQDVNAEQVEMLYLLSSKHRNLVVVGDDDQGIYGFRGGDASFMLNFPMDFPDASVVVLTDNFRSTGALVSAARELISNNTNRIAKEIRSSSGNQKDMLPVLIENTSLETLESILGHLQEQGYAYEDIAILATKNATLTSLHKALSVPTVLGKSYLINDAFFLLLYSVMQLWKDMDNDRAFYQFMKLHGVDFIRCETGYSLLQTLLREMGIADFAKVMEKRIVHPAYEPLVNLYIYIQLIEKALNSAEIVDNMVSSCGWNGSDSASVLIEELEKHKTYEKGMFLEWMERMVACESERRVEIDNEGRVLLITSHDSKGREFKVVILVNDFSNGGEEGRRLFYVALTRAKEEFYLMQEKDAKTDFVSELPHIKMEVA